MGGIIRQTAKNDLSIRVIWKNVSQLLYMTANELAMAHILPSGIRLEGKLDQAGLWHCVRS
jgi:hypothetical protein